MVRFLPSSFILIDIESRPQSKDKFLSAAAAEGFGFCSVILYVSSHYITHSIS
jgi:hypothetical protein